MTRREGNGTPRWRRSVRGALHFRRREETVGLDIGSGWSKAAVIDHSGAAPRLIRIALTPTPPGAETGDAADPGPAAGAIASMFQREGIDGREVVIGVGGGDVVSKRIEVDRMPEREARAVLPWEAEQHVPFDMESVQLAFSIADPDGDGPRMTVLLAAARLGLIESRLALLRGAGLRPAAIDVESFALLNACEANHPQAMRGVTALVDVGAATTKVNVMEDGLPVLARDLPCGTDTLVDALRREAGHAADEAESVLRGEDGARGLDDLSEVLTSLAHPVAAGIERAARLLEREDVGLGIARIYLCGGGAGVAGLSRVVAGRLGIETRVANVVERLEAGPDVAEDPRLTAVSPLLMPAVGLALRRPEARRRPRAGRLGRG